MNRKKSIELVEETGNPQALIVNGKGVSDFLSKTLKNRGCEVTRLESYSPTPYHFDYIFLFDNGSAADKIYEKNLSSSGKFIFIATESDGDFPLEPKIKIFQTGDLSFWNMQELSDKILRVMFSSSRSVVEAKKITVIPIKKKEIITKPVIVGTQSEARGTPESLKDPGRTSFARMTENPKVIVEKTSYFFIPKILAILIIFIFLGLITFAGFSYFYILKIQKTLVNLNYHLKVGDFNSLSSDLDVAKIEAANLDKVYKIGKIILFPLKDTETIKNIDVLFSESEKNIEASREFIVAVKDILPSGSGFANISENFSSEKMAVFHEKTGNLLLSLTQTKLKFSKISVPFVSLSNITASLSPVINKLTSVYELLPVFEKIFFSDGTRIYLVLLQNNMELRPTGGFIGSYGLLTMADKKIKDFKIEDVYTADGQLKGHVDPPVPIRKYLNQPHFFLRDSNFDPDFAVSSAQAMWFLQKELGKEVDGAIGANLTLAQKLMQVTGSIKLSDFENVEINSDNFFRKVHELTNTNFFPGSTQKKDVLTAIAGEMMLNLTNQNKINFLDLLSQVKNALEEKNILLYFRDEALQKTIEEQGWAGRMVDVSCTNRRNRTGEIIQTNDNCLADYLSVNEANLGVNKANYFINKSQVLEKEIGKDGKITTNLTITYENQNISPADTPLTYVNYLRVFVPLGSQLKSLTLNNANVAPADIDTQNYASDKTSFGTLVKIAPGNKGVVKITYTLPSLFSSSADSYQLFFQKQAGDKNSPLVVILNYPEDFKLKPENFTSTSQKGGEIYYATDNSVDRVFALKKE